MILNFQSNAIKFTEFGKVTIITSIEDRVLKVQVKDTGTGISEENQKKLFKLFGFISDTQDKNVNGIGLGLMITQQLVQQFNGKIGVDSKPGMGSVFYFELNLQFPEE